MFKGFFFVSAFLLWFCWWHWWLIFVCVLLFVGSYYSYQYHEKVSDEHSRIYVQPMLHKLLDKYFK